MIVGSIFILVNLLFLSYYFLFNKLSSFVFLILLNFSVGRLFLIKIGFEYGPAYDILLILIINVVFLITSLKARTNNRMMWMFIVYTALFLSYMLINSVFQNPEVNQFKLVKHYFWGEVFFLFIINSYNRIDEKVFDNFVLKFIFFYGVLGVLQFFVDPISLLFRVYSYSWNGVETVVLPVNVYVGQNVVIGTFFRMANFGNLMGLLTVYIYSKKSINPQLFNSIFSTLGILIALIAIALTGIRTSFLSTLLGLIAISFFHNKKVFYYSILSVPLLIFYNISMLMQMGVMGVSRSGSFDNPIQRILGVFYLFSSEDSYKKMTVTRSMNIMDEFLRNPLFGTGKYTSLFNMGISSTTDASFLIMLIQHGIIGVGILFIPYFLLLSSLKRVNSTIYILFLVLFGMLLIQTITDKGLYEFIVNIFFWVMAAVNIIVYQTKKKVN